MAKTVKRNVKSKTTNTKNVVPQETTINENVTIPIIENDDEGENEPKLVNEKNEIIYNPQEDLKKIIDEIDVKIPKDLMEDDVKEGIEYLKNNVSIPTDIGKDINKSLEFVEKQMEELNRIKTNIMENSKKSKNNFNFTTYWNGIVNNL